jgi:hypothetical protein
LSTEALAKVEASAQVYLLSKANQACPNFRRGCRQAGITQTCKISAENIQGKSFKAEAKASHAKNAKGTKTNNKRFLGKKRRRR